MINVLIFIILSFCAQKLQCCDTTISNLPSLVQNLPADIKNNIANQLLKTVPDRSFSAKILTFGLNPRLDSGSPDSSTHPILVKCGNTSIATANRDGTVHVYDEQSGKKIHTLPGHNVVHVGFDTNGNMTTLSKKGIIATWDKNSGKKIKTHEVPGGNHAGDFKTMSNDGTSVVSHNEQKHNIYNTRTGHRQTLDRNPHGYSSTAISSKGGYFASQNDMYHVNLVNTKQQSSSLLSGLDINDIVQIVFDGNETKLAILGDETKHIGVRELPGGKLCRTIKASTDTDLGRLYSICFTHDNNNLVCSGTYGSAVYSLDPLNNQKFCNKLTLEEKIWLYNQLSTPGEPLNAHDKQLKQEIEQKFQLSLNLQVL